MDGILLLATISRSVHYSAAVPCKILRGLVSCKVTRPALCSAVCLTCLSAGSSWATRFQMAPVPPCLGNLNTALGPQPASSLRWMTLLTARSTSTVATRSPSHLHCISVVGTPHTCRCVNKQKARAVTTAPSPQTCCCCATLTPWRTSAIAAAPGGSFVAAYKMEKIRGAGSELVSCAQHTP